MRSISGSIHISSLVKIWLTDLAGLSDLTTIDYCRIIMMAKLNCFLLQKQDMIERQMGDTMTSQIDPEERYTLEEMIAMQTKLGIVSYMSRILIICK